MKKRIISLILVVVIAALTLTSCGYSFAKDDLSVYAEFKDVEGFKKAWESLVIEDGDFTTDEELREKKVWDAIYSSLASAIKSTGEKKTEGMLTGHDILYYCYYCTAEFDGETVVLFASNMKASSTVSVQLGMGDPSGVEKGVADLVTGVDLKDKVYTTETVGTVKEGDVVYVSYTYTHEVEVKDEATGETAKKPETVNVTNERLVIKSGTSALADHLLANSAGINVSTIEDFDKDGKSYTGIKVNWRANGEALGSFVDKTYDEKKLVTDVNGESRDLNGKDLTYYIYPVNYMSVPEYNATNLVNEILTSNITIDAMTLILFGEDYEDKTDDEKKALLDEYITKDKDNKDVSLEDFVKALATLQKDLATAKSTYEKSEDDLSDKQTAYDKAKESYEADKTDAKKDTLDKAETALNDAKTTNTDNKKKYDDKLAERDAKVTALLAMKPDMPEKLTNGYKTAQYNALLDAYNYEIKMNLATEIYALFEKYVTVTGTPDKAVDATYDQLIQNYQHEFNTGTYDTDKGISNYAQYKGNFKKFLVDSVTADIKKVENYDDALKAVREKAVEYVTPVVRIYVVSKALDQLATDEEYKEYKENPDNNYSYNEYSYGESSVLHAYQFDKLMNYILEYEEDDKGAYVYKWVHYDIGEKADAAE